MRDKEDKTGLSQHFTQSAEIWPEQHVKIITDVKKAVGDRLNMIAESEMWEMIATRSSPEWLSAKNSLASSKKDFDERMSDDNIPLGALGAALDGGDLDHAANIYTRDLANFTVVNESLRQQSDMKRILKTLMDVRKTADKSLQVSHQVKNTNIGLDAVLKNEKKTVHRHHFNDQSRKAVSFKEALDTGMRNMTSYFLKKAEDGPKNTPAPQQAKPSKQRLPKMGM